MNRRQFHKMLLLGVGLAFCHVTKAKAKKFSYSCERFQIKYTGETNTVWTFAMGKNKFVFDILLKNGGIESAYYNRDGEHIECKSFSYEILLPRIDIESYGLVERLCDMKLPKIIVKLDFEIYV